MHSKIHRVIVNDYVIVFERSSRANSIYRANDRNKSRITKLVSAGVLSKDRIVTSHVRNPHTVYNVNRFSVTVWFHDIKTSTSLYHGDMLGKKTFYFQTRTMLDRFYKTYSQKYINCDRWGSNRVLLSIDI